MSVNFSYSRFPHDFIRKGYSAKFGPYSTAIYLCLLHHKNNKTGDCFPSEKSIARKMGMSRNTVREHIKKLLEYRIISRVKKSSINGKEVFHYTIYDPDQWLDLNQDIETICSPDEQHKQFFHSITDDVQITEDVCSFEEQSSVHDLNLNKKKETKRNNKELNSIKDNDRLVDEWNAKMDKLTGVNPQLREKLMNTYVLKNMGDKSS